MKIRILSDIHNEFQEYTPPHVLADVVVLAGDIHIKEKAIPWITKNFKNIPVIYVLGNHEFYGAFFPQLLVDLKEKLSGTHIYLLENDTVKIGDVAFFGSTFWTDFKLFGESPAAKNEAHRSITDYRRIKLEHRDQRLEPMHTCLRHTESKIFLENAIASCSSKKKVVVTHHAPARQSLLNRGNLSLLSASYASGLESWLETLDFDLWVHGHIHAAMDFNIGNKRIVCNPKGYPSEVIQGFKEDFVIDI